MRPWIIPDPSEDAHAPVASRDPRTRAAPAYRETAADSPCPLCEAVQDQAGAFRHENSCPAARRRAVR